MYILARDRLELHSILESMLGSKNVYYQPPESIKIKYPAIIYTLDDVETKYADNGIFLSLKRYQITVIDSNPDSVIYEKIMELPYCSFSRRYPSNNLNHIVLTIYF